MNNKILIFLTLLIMNFSGSAMRLSYSNFQASKDNYYAIQNGIQTNENIVNLSKLERCVSTASNKEDLENIFSEDIMTLLSNCVALLNNDSVSLSSDEDYINMKIVDCILSKFSLICEIITRKAILMDDGLQNKLSAYIMK